MSTDYMEALRCQLAELEDARSLRGRAAPSIVRTLMEASPTYVASWVARSLREAADALADGISLSEEDPCIPAGFGWFSTPFRHVIVDPDGDAITEDVYAVAWRIGGHAYPSAPHIRESGVNIVAYGRDLADLQRKGTAIGFWAFGESLGHEPPTSGAPSNLEADDASAATNATFRDIKSWLYSLWAFMRERRVTTISHRGVDRPLRKQAERAGWTHEPIVQVVELRAAEPRHAPSGEHDTVDWSCRWAVRGHWHKYHYGDGTVRARWLAPYVKGPAGKALKSATKLLAVVR